MTFPWCGAIVLAFCFATASEACSAHARSAPISRPAPTCLADSLWIGAGAEGSATGHGLTVVAIVNAGQSSCSLFGTHSVTLTAHDAAGRETQRIDVPSPGVHSSPGVSLNAGGFMLSGKAATAVVIGQDRAAYFGIETQHICQPDSTPPTRVDELDVAINGTPIAPGLPIPVSISLCNSAMVGPFRSHLADVGP